MKPYPNRIARFVLLLSIMVGLVACKPNPQDDIALFQPFITENINKKSADPYISSTVKPGDKMYEILVNIQHGQWDVAEGGLLSLIDEGNPDAMLWYARMLLLDNNKRREVINLIFKSLTLGNPYAALAIAKNSHACAYLGTGSLDSQVAQSLGISDPNSAQLCTDDNFQKAIELFKPLSEKGDLRAQYFLLKQQELDQSKETRAQYIQEVIRFSQNHYYQPLMDYVNTILIYSPSKGKSESKTVEQYQLAIDLLTIAANNNYIPAVNDLAYYLKETSKEESERLRNLALKLGSTSAVEYKYHRSHEGSENKYFYNALYKGLSGKYAFDVHTLNEEEKAKVNEKVKLFMKDITPMVYIDGFTRRNDWVD
ncbi:sel1 repeat family protein [Vibrio fluvialis]|uniref:sel1 repeat family protein n=1 Tax=Vibrio fluvialis TaxID=676 RepID=UPI001559EAF2|nr:sel1 repeat family protein [Vibrio fluvialis]MBY7906129.1 sel1 repeat family protein [Vibrio fluvialis]MBY8176124.1 sel1 repeat family protein [Vibrio fluvialis]MBY8196184.1 sel1 repeat family protein [Vibrio fluvialis]MBY8309337.1 sel1 repeat family protein [Vibrio fluvialis]MCE7649294.1 sel1 repeat family protein [Vibrio fluvialis]